MKIRFDVNECPECGGSGAYYAKRGARCFKCGGAGKIRTPDANAAAKKIEAIYDAAWGSSARDIKAGDIVYLEPMRRTVCRWIKVTEANPSPWHPEMFEVHDGRVCHVVGDDSHVWIKSPLSDSDKGIIRGMKGVTVAEVAR